jgi:excisionase family DNA binding protein
MTPTHEAAVRAATEALVGAILAAVKAEAAATAEAPDRLLSIDEAARLLGIGRSATYDLLGAGRLRSLAIGRRRLVPSAAFREYIEQAGARAAGR